ncbi:MAG: hypothetical protein ABFE08_16520 [Armatimonadia bacterium]
MRAGGRHPAYPRLTCQIHLRQLQYAALAYAQDYDDRFPRRPSPGGDWMVWKWSALRQPDSRSFRPIGTDDGPLTPYTRNYRTIIACPEDRSQQAETSTNVPHSSYTWNNALCGKLAQDVPNHLLIWDRAPFHDRGRNVIAVSGKPRWVSEKDFAPLIAK